MACSPQLLGNTAIGAEVPTEQTNILSAVCNAETGKEGARLEDRFSGLERGEKNRCMWGGAGMSLGICPKQGVLTGGKAARLVDLVEVFDVFGKLQLGFVDSSE